MHVGELLYQVAEAGITLTCSKIGDGLNAKPTSALQVWVGEDGFAYDGSRLLDYSRATPGAA